MNDEDKWGLMGTRVRVNHKKLHVLNDGSQPSFPERKEFS